MSATPAHTQRTSSRNGSRGAGRRSRSALFVFVFLWLVGGLVVAPLVAAAWPPDEKLGPVDYSDRKNWPSDPGFGGQWESWSFAPKEYTKLDARTRRLGMGGHYDRAWARTAGDPRVVIAVLDSGAYWDQRDLVNKWFLNAAELPPPADDCQKPEHRGDGKRVYDANGDGVFNVQDYTRATGHQQPDYAKACDARISDANRNGLLDPQDLLATFSDRKDDDANGYVDDIAGWDFYRNDNDAYDDTRYGHGNGEAHDSSAEGDNAIAESGVCPRCRVMPLRVGDSFVADANDFGLAATYAVDIGASVIQEALGTLDNTPLSRWAIDYAYDNHVAVIASAADENSYHHNFPATNNHTIYVHAIRYNAEKPQDATNAFAFDNCTNYGAQLLLSVPGTSCSSEATGRSSGMAGLIYSAALAANLPAPPRLHPLPGPGGDAPAGDRGPVASRVRRLTAEEVRQLMLGSADSFYDPDDTANPAVYPTGHRGNAPDTVLKSGYDFVRRFGYGRVNARAAVDRILDGAIPAEVEIESPAWFEVLRPSRGTVPIQGRIALRNPADRYDFAVEWAPGVDPRDEQYQRLGGGELQSAGLEGPLASLPVSQIRVNNPVLMRDDPAWQPDDIAHVHALTVRVRVIQRSLDPKRNGLVSEARRTVHVHEDPDLLPGFPIDLGASGEASPKTADLDGDGRREIIVVDSGGRVHALRADGRELAGFPVTLPSLPGLDAGPSGHLGAPAWKDPVSRPRPSTSSAVMASPAVGDVNGDGKLEIVVATWDGHVVAIGASGSVLPGFPVRVDLVSPRVSVDSRHVIDDGFFAAPVLVDLDRDGRLDIVGAAMDGQLYVWKGDGQRLAGFPVIIWDERRPDDPRDPEPRQRQRIMSTPAVGDLTGDGIPELVFATNEQYGETGRVYAIDGRGSKAPKLVLPGWPVAVNSRDVLPVVGVGIPNAPAMGDIDGDGVPEVFINGIGGELAIIKANGMPFGTNLVTGRQGFGSEHNASEFATLGFIASPALGDLDSDGTIELLLPTAGGNAALSMLKKYQRLDYEMHLSAWDTKTGKQKPGFPRVMEDYEFFMNPIVVDLDADGQKEVIAGSAGYFVHAYDASGKSPKGFPKLTGGWIATTPTVGDLDGDGRLELIASTRNGWLFAWHTRGRDKGRMDWVSFHHDNQNTGNLATRLDQGGDEVDPKPPLPVDDPPEVVDEPAGCSCSIGTQPGRQRDKAVNLFALVLLFGYAVARRRLFS